MDVVTQHLHSLVPYLYSIKSKNSTAAPSKNRNSIKPNTLIISIATQEQHIDFAKTIKQT